MFTDACFELAAVKVKNTMLRLLARLGNAVNIRKLKFWTHYEHPDAPRYELLRLKEKSKPSEDRKHEDPGSKT